MWPDKACHVTRQQLCVVTYIVWQQSNVHYYIIIIALQDVRINIEVIVFLTVIFVCLRIESTPRYKRIGTCVGAKKS